MFSLEYKKSSFCVAIMIFCLSFFINPHYIFGDQNIYITVYNKLASLGFIEGFSYYTHSLSSYEPGHFALAWIFSPWIDKNLFVSSLNALLAFYSMQLLFKWKASVYVASSIVLTNFYLYVLYFAAERLKVSFIFLTMAFVYSNGLKFYIFSLFSLVSHAQVSIIYVMVFLKEALYELKIIMLYGKVKYFFLAAVIFLIIGLFLIYPQLKFKFNSYIFHYLIYLKIEEIYKLVVFYLATLYYSKKRLEISIFFVTLMLAAFVLGASRVSMIGYFVFLYYALQINKGLNLGVGLTTFYFLYKTVIFIVKIFKYGNGFDNRLF